MRKIVVLSFISMDGVMQAPGGPEEDPTGGFKFGGWTFGYFDEDGGWEMGKQMDHPFDLLLGRKTYEIFAAYWPYVKSGENEIAAAFGRAWKFVASRSDRKLSWANSVLLAGDVVEEVRSLKAQDGPELQVHGSGNLIQTLLKADLVDEMWLKFFPVILGKGKRLFGEGAQPAGFTLSGCHVTPSGIIFANYARAGEVKTGSFGSADTSAEELARRRGLAAEAVAARKMAPRITAVTLGVNDLEKALRFYRDGLGLPTQGIVGTEFEYGAVAFFELRGGITLALYPRASLARDVGAPVPAASLEGSIGYRVDTEAEVDAMMALAKKAGAAIVKPAQKAFWGGYAGYFQDPDGHLWETFWNPAAQSAD